MFTFEPDPGSAAGADLAGIEARRRRIAVVVRGHAGRELAGRLLDAAIAQRVDLGCGSTIDVGEAAAGQVVGVDAQLGLDVGAVQLLGATLGLGLLAARAGAVDTVSASAEARAITDTRHLAFHLAGSRILEVGIDRGSDASSRAAERGHGAKRHNGQFLHG